MLFQIGRIPDYTTARFVLRPQSVIVQNVQSGLVQCTLPSRADDGALYIREDNRVCAVVMHRKDMLYLVCITNLRANRALVRVRCAAIHAAWFVASGWQRSHTDSDRIARSRQSLDFAEDRAQNLGERLRESETELVQ